METKKFLNEENYQKNKTKVVYISIIILVLGILIGGGLILKGLSNSGILTLCGKPISVQIEEEKQNLIMKKSELDKKIQATKNQIQVQVDKLNVDLATLKAKQNEEFYKNGFSEKYYSLENDKNRKEEEIIELRSQTKAEENDIRVIEDALDESFDHCAFQEAKNNSYTAKYCSLKNKHDSFHNIPYYMFGGFIIIASCMIAGSIYMIAKRREMLAFTLQQVMPVAQEGIDTMAPTIGNVAKEITKGIKEGIKDEKE